MMLRRFKTMDRSFVLQRRRVKSKHGRFESILRHKQMKLGSNKTKRRSNKTKRWRNKSEHPRNETKRRRFEMKLWSIRVKRWCCEMTLGRIGMKRGWSESERASIESSVVPRETMQICAM